MVKWLSVFKHVGVHWCQNLVTKNYTFWRTEYLKSLIRWSKWWSLSMRLSYSWFSYGTNGSLFLRIQNFQFPRFLTHILSLNYSVCDIPYVYATFIDAGDGRWRQKLCVWDVDDRFGSFLGLAPPSQRCHQHNDLSPIWKYQQDKSETWRFYQHHCSHSEFVRNGQNFLQGKIKIWE